MKKLTIENMQDYAKAHNGKCLSDTYINSKTKIKMKCEQNHVWNFIPNTMYRDFWCPHCSKRAKLTIEDMISYAEKHDGKCLSDTYINNRNKIEFQCNKCDYIWKMTPANMCKNVWCLGVQKT